ncbi:hypothetical protein ACFCYH_17760 [Streptomyces sp. NPDC056400]|uniref:hypothetical protein n=1 Tax=Streptomyces sp. NPDC056400 TaxID=3345808 RepID=UPI0035E038A3
MSAPLAHGRQNLREVPAYRGIVPRPHGPLQAPQFTQHAGRPGLGRDVGGRAGDLDGLLRLAGAGRCGGVPGEVDAAVPAGRRGYGVEDLRPQLLGLPAEAETAVAGGPLYLQVARGAAAGVAPGQVVVDAAEELSGVVDEPVDGRTSCGSRLPLVPRNGSSRRVP